MALQVRRALGLLLALSAALAAAAPPASASEGGLAIAPGSFAVRLLNAEGNPETRAGSHPDRLQVDFGFEGEESIGTLEFQLPPGFLGNPNAVHECPRQAHEEGEECSPQTQVGTFKLGAPGGAGLPIYRLEPGPGEVASFGSKAGIEFHSAIELRPDDFGMTLTVSDLPELALGEGHFELWGIPADHQEGTPGEPIPFLTTPSTCGPLRFTLRARSQAEGAPWLSAGAETAAQSGCETLGFGPGLGLSLSDPVADSPTGLRMELIEPEPGTESELADAQLKDVTVQLPAGMTVSPGGAGGLTACSDAQLGLGKEGDASCPPASKVGNVEIEAPIFGEPLTGAVYLGEERPGERFRLLVAVPGPGFVLKFVGALQADPATGRLSAALRDLPQAELGRLTMSLDGGPTALLASPLACGPTSAAASFVPYGGGAQVDSTATLAIAGRTAGTQCPGPVPFAPQLLAESSSRKAGGPSSFTTTLRRTDGESLPRRFVVSLPAGMSAALGSVSACSAADAAASTCPAESRVGGVVGEAGPGPSPATLSGDVYLTGPYRRAPFGLLLTLGARFGPFDLGTLAFRAALDVNGRTGGVTVSSDPLPDVVEGVQVRLQSIELGLDRPGFIRNPTSCGSRDVDASIEATTGVVANATSSFETVGCGHLGFKPRIRIALERHAAHGGGHAGLRIAVRLRRADTALRTMRISLPRTVKLDTSSLDAICSLPDARHDECPSEARVGTVLARSPQLGERLRGGAYVVQPSGGGQPDIWLSLTQAGLRVAFRGRTESDRGHFVTKLAGLPDIPLTRLVLRLGRGDGAFSLPENACGRRGKARLAAAVFARGQDGARWSSRVPIATRAHCRAAHHRPRRRVLRRHAARESSRR